jgi:hypothetical protein
MGLQLQPGGGFQGVLGATAPIKRLQLYCCRLFDEGFQLAPALALLPGLQHLSYNLIYRIQSTTAIKTFPASVLRGLLQLTLLELSQCEWEGLDDLRDLQGLTRLRDLQLGPQVTQSRTLTISASMLSGLQELIQLRVNAPCFEMANGHRGDWLFEPDSLAGKTMLQHLEVSTLSSGQWTSL